VIEGESGEQVGGELESVTSSAGCFMQGCLSVCLSVCVCLCLSVYGSAESVKVKVSVPYSTGV